MIESQVKSVFEQEQAPSPSHTPFPVIVSKSTPEEMEEMPELEEVQPTPLPVITPISTVEKLEEMFEQQEIQLAPLPAITSTRKNVQTTSPVPTSITDDSQAMRVDTNGHLIAPSTKVEDPDIDISNEHIEGGDSDDDVDVSEDLLWQNEVKFPYSTIRNVVD